MKRIVFLGNSEIAVSAMERIRELDKDAEITFITSEYNLPYQKEYLVSFLRGEMALKDVLLRPDDFYKDNNIRVINDKKILRANLHRKQIVLEDKEAIHFDQLVITEVSDFKLPEIKGTKKVGVLTAARLDDMQKIVNLVSFLDSIIVQSDRPVGEEVANILSEKKKEVVLIKPSGQPPVETPEEPKAEEAVEGDSETDAQEEAASELADEDETADQASPLRTFYGQKIEEILGDSDAKAVRLDNGKVYASDLVIFTEAKSHLRLFYDTSLEINERICVDDHFKSNMGHVFAAGAVSEKRDKSQIEDRSNQDIGRALADSIMGVAAQPDPLESQSTSHVSQDGSGVSQPVENISVGEAEAGGTNG